MPVLPPLRTPMSLDGSTEALSIFVFHVLNALFGVLALTPIKVEKPFNLQLRAVEVVKPLFD